MSASILKVVCGWCSLVMRAGDLPVSHGLCTRCARRFEANETAGVSPSKPRTVFRKSSQSHLGYVTT
jgi:hypothetical protein